MRLCSFEGCGRKHMANGLCLGHYSQVRRGSPLRPLRLPSNKPIKLCSFGGCERKHAGLGLCDSHYAQVKRGESLRPIGYRPVKVIQTCTFIGCDRKRHGKKEFCKTHDEQQRNSVELRSIKAWYPEGLLCRLDFCDKEADANFLCIGHYAQQIRGYVEFLPLENIRSGLSKKELLKLSGERRRARVENSFIQEIDRQLVFDIYNGCCYLCGEELDYLWDLDHIQPLVKGGKHAYHNVAPSHPTCNRSKGSKELVQICTYRSDQE